MNSNSATNAYLALAAFFLLALLPVWVIVPLRLTTSVGIPCAILHYALMLPGKLLAGTPPLGHSLFILSVSIILAWAYLRSKRSLLAVIFLHGWINAPSFLVAENANSLFWLATAAWVGLAFLIVTVTRGKLENTDDH